MSLRSWAAVCAVICCGFVASSSWGAGQLANWRYLPLTPDEQRDVEKTRVAIETRKDQPKVIAEYRKNRGVNVYTDRKVYLAGDEIGQIVVDGWIFAAWGDAAAVRVTLTNAPGAELNTATVPLTDAGQSCKVVFQLATDKLTPGNYQLAAEILGADQKVLLKSSPAAFVRSAEQSPQGKIPAAGVALSVGSLADKGGASWPISTGIPMPRSAVRDPARLVLLEDGKPIPAQWTVRSRWSPAADAPVRWVGLDFVAQFRDGQPRAYRLGLAESSSTAITSPLQVTDDKDQIEVSTGPLRFTIRRSGFTGMHTAWLNGEAVVNSEAGAGPFIVDEAGRRHFAYRDPQAQVTIEEKGPVRVVLQATGWYVADDPAAPRLCRFVTHITAYAGVPAVFITHRTIIAYDTRTTKLADIGFTVPLRGADKWATGIDGAAQQGALPAGNDTVWLHQYRDDRVRLTEKMEGKRADGWMMTSSDKATLLCSLRDIWQKFPKELEVGRKGLTLHFWPRHGLQTFTEAEELDRKQIFKARFAHQGSLLDLQMPQRYYDKLKEWDDASRWDPEHTAPIGFASTGEGVAISNDFALWFLPPATDVVTAALTAQRFQAPPHALAESQWNVAAGIDAPMSPRDEQRWPLAERMLNHDFPTAMFNIVEKVGAYGMWIYANTFNTWRDDQPELHRAWQNSHYGHVGEAWKLYFRGASPEVLRWARAQSDHFLNIATVHHVIPEVSAPGRQIGAMYHAKGFLPWGARQRGQFPNDGDVRNWGHFIDPDAHLWRYLLEGDLFARDVYNQWTGSINNGTFPMHGPGRESINDVSMLLNAYAMTWDPQAVILLYRRGIDVTLATPLENAKTSVASFPVWHKRWPDRYYMLTRDENVVSSIASYLRTGYWHWTPAAFAYRRLHDPTFLEPIAPEAYALVHQVYRHEGDPLDGFADYASARDQERMLQLPELMAALNAAGFDESKLLLPTGFYPQGDILALNPDGRDFHLKIEMPAMSGGFDHLIKVIAPSGKVVRTVVIGATKGKTDDTTVILERARYVGAQITQVAVPAGSEKGLFKVQTSGYACFLAAPISDLPHEAAQLNKDSLLRFGGRFVGFLAAPAAGTVELSVTATGVGNRPPMVPDVVYARLGAESAGPLLETTLLHIAAQPRASVTLPSAASARVHPLTVLGASTLRWTGDAPRVLIGPRGEDVATILAAQP